MARLVTVIVKLIDGSHSAGVDMRSDSSSWEKAESNNANNVFTTNKGPFRKIGAQTELLRPGGGLRVGRLENFDVKIVQNGASGQGLSDDAGTAITWRVDGVAEI